MISITAGKTSGFPDAILGMRNPMNSWAHSDSEWKWAADGPEFKVGEKDLELAHKLIDAGSDHRKFLRMIVVWTNITAPLYWWKEFDTYKIGTVANSCSTMHKIHAKPFELDDFSHEHLTGTSETALMQVIDTMNLYRDMFVKQQSMTAEDRKELWWQMIQLLPSSYNQTRTVMMNYEVLRNIYFARANHKLDEWHTFRRWIERLPYSELITGERHA